MNYGVVQGIQFQNLEALNQVNALNCNNTFEFKCSCAIIGADCDPSEAVD